MKFESDEAKNTAVPTKSEGSSCRGNDCMEIEDLDVFSVSNWLRLASVAVYPGAIAFILIPDFPNALAKAWVSVNTAPLLHAYGKSYTFDYPTFHCHHYPIVPYILNVLTFAF